MTESEELELLELENENAAIAKTSPIPHVPGATTEDVSLAAATPADIALQAAGQALETPIMESPIVNPAGLPDVLTMAKEGITNASTDAGKYYSDLGVPRIGKAVEMGGKFAAGMIPARMKDALFIAAAGPAMEAAGVLANATGVTTLVKAGGNMLADIAGSIAGKSPEAVKAIYKTPGALWKKANEVFTLKNQEALVGHIDEGLKARGAQFKELENALSGFVGTTGVGKPPEVMLRPTFDKVKFEMLNRGYELPKSMAPGIVGPKVGRLPVSSPEYKFLIEKMSFLDKNPRLGFGDVLNMRRQLDDAISYGLEGSNGLQPISGAAQSVLKVMRRDLNEQLKTAVPKDVRPHWDAANKAYSDASSAYAELRKQVIGQTPRQTERKLLQMVQEGRYDDEVLSRANALGEKAAKALDDVRDHLAAKEFQRWTAGGLGKGAFGILPTSPRVVGMGVSGVGAGAQLLSQVAKHPTISAIISEGLSK